MVNPDQYDTLAEFLKAQYEWQKEAGGVSKQQVANEITVSGAYVSQLHSGRADTAVPKWPGERALQFLRSHRLATDEIRRVAERFGLVNVRTYLDLRDRNQPVEVRSATRTVKHLGTVSAGRFGAAFALDVGEAVDIPDMILRHYDPSDVFALDVTGDSMMCDDLSRSIPPGVRVYFHSMLRPGSGDTVCCRLVNEDMSVIKIFRPGHGFITLASRNGSHRPIIVDENNPAEVEGVSIGRIFAD